MDAEILCCNHRTFTWYHLLLLIIIIIIIIIIVIISIITIMIMIIMIIIWKGYFSVNPILSFGSLKVKKVLLSMWSRPPNI